MDADAQTGSTHGWQGMVRLFPERVRGSPEYSQKPPWGNPHVHPVEIRLLKEGRRASGWGLLRGPLCVCGSAFLPNNEYLRGTPRPVREGLTATSEVTPDPTILGFGEDHVNHLE